MKLKKWLAAAIVTLSCLGTSIPALAEINIGTDIGGEFVNGVSVYHADTLLWGTDYQTFSLTGATLFENNPWGPESAEWVDEWAYAIGYRNGVAIYHQDFSVAFNTTLHVAMDFANVDMVVFNSGAISDGTRLLATDFTGSGFAPPVPEPEAYAMLLAGLALLGAVARRRKQAQS